MKNVCVFIPWFYPAYKAGGPIQSIANMVQQFQENIAYEIFCSNKDLDGTVLNVPVKKWIFYNENSKVWYSSDKIEPIITAKKEFRKTNVDVLLINGIYSWKFNLKPLLLCGASKKIVSVRGMLNPGALSEKYLKKKIYLTLWKIFRLHNLCYFHATSEEEKTHIQTAFGKKVKVVIAQNFPRVFNKQNSYQKDPGFLQLVSIALISSMKNHLIILEALVKCRNRISYNLYGPIKDKNYWNECLEQIKKMPDNITVKYHGEVLPQMVNTELSKNDVFILPSKSENFSHAIYEALTAGKPVITSNFTPWNNLQANKAGINVDINKDQLSKAIDFFADMGQEEYNCWNEGANQYAIKAIDIEDIKDQYRKMFFA